jgi:uncharacterized protein YndB with AHSA1/START domain
MTATITLEQHANGTKYSALVRHSNKDSRIAHGKMGFEEGWGTCLDQLVAIINKS